MTENAKETTAKATKPPLHLLEHAANCEIARALQTGADKYGERNYRTVPVKATIYAGAIMRHVGAWLDGEDLDPESGVSHVAHVGAGVHILLDAMRRGNFVDDRGPRPQTDEQRSTSDSANEVATLNGVVLCRHEDVGYGDAHYVGGETCRVAVCNDCGTQLDCGHS